LFAPIQSKKPVNLTKLPKRTLRQGIEILNGLRPKHWDATRLSAAQKQTPLSPVAPAMRNLEAAIDWLARAQDASGTEGVSWGYRGRTAVRSGATAGWMPAYPETTGYIIETVLRHARSISNSTLIDRARRMADWEAAIQLADGGIQGGMYGQQPVSSSTFVTGQVLFGFIAAYQEFKTDKYLTAALRSGDYLLDCLDDQGRFTKGYSHFCEAGPKAYEARTGWALAQLGALTGDDRYFNAARKMAAFAVSCQQPNGWFDHNDLDYHTIPLTHTIGYVLEGLLGIALLSPQERFEPAVFRALDKIAPLVQPNGFLAGRWNAKWQPAVDWCCLTGSAQLAIVFYRASRIQPNPDWTRAASRLLGFVTATQALAGHPGRRGGIQGSYPFDGDYGQWCILNWATKFYADAVMESGVIQLDPAPLSSVTVE
jgi:uncharacterized protein YyaL (SSP411 family)